MLVVSAALGLCAPLLSGCGLGVLSGTTHPDAASPPSEPPLTVCDPSNLPSPSCATTCAQAQQILKTNCYACHGGGSIGNLAGVSDYHALSNVQASANFPGWVYVLPGDPERSLIYHRTAITQDMPPPSTIDSPLPHPSVSDFSVLHEWIQSCIPNLPGPDAATPPPTPSPDAGSDGGASFTFTSCPTTPPTGTCSIPRMTCPYSTQTCTCDNGSWACHPCPAAQPATGTVCPATQFDGGAPEPFICGYGNVTCGCVPDPHEVDSPTWACGVCPNPEPGTGQACGNTAISCAYADQQCNCNNGTWVCSAPHCPRPASAEDNVVETCAGFYACDYPALDQSCACKSPVVSSTVPDAKLECTCPAALPPNGGDCVVPIVSPCSYSDQSCTCGGGRWHCGQACPPVAPADGSSCGSTLNCSYGSGLCYCDGTVWHCS